VERPAHASRLASSEVFTFERGVHMRWCGQMTPADSSLSWRKGPFLQLQTAAPGMRAPAGRRPIWKRGTHLLSQAARGWRCEFPTYSQRATASPYASSRTPKAVGGASVKVHMRRVRRSDAVARGPRTVQ